MAQPISIHDLYTNIYLNDIDGVHSDTLDTQEEIDQAVGLVYNSGKICSQRGFQEFSIPKIHNASWNIPALFGEPLQALGKIESKDPGKLIGWVDIPVPFSIDIQDMARRYFPEGKYRKVMDKAEYLLDSNGNPIFIFGRNEKGNIISVYSPLSGPELAKVLLALPKVYQSQFQCLLGLPKAKTSEVKAYVQQRLNDELKQTPQGPTSGGEYDSFCHVTRDEQWRAPKGIREAVLSQCSKDPTNVHYPAYGVTNAHSIQSTLMTRGLNSCMGVILRDRKTTETLLAHLPTGETPNEEMLNQDLFCVMNYSDNMANTEELPKLDWPLIENLLGKAYERSTTPPYCNHGHATFPYEWYVGIFQHEYFANSDPSDMEATVISGTYTPYFAVKEMALLIQKYFPGVQPKHKDPLTYGFDFQVDSRTGEVTAQDGWRGYPRKLVELSKTD